MVMNERAYWSLIALLITWAFFFWSSLKNLVVHHSLTTFLLGLTIIGAFFYTIYKKSGELREVPYISSQFGLLDLTILVAVWIIAGVVGLASVQNIAVLLMLPAIIHTSCGPFVIRVLAFPFFYTLLLIPLFDVTFPNRNIVPWVAFGLMFAYLRYQTMPYRLLYILISIFIGFIAIWKSWNWIVSAILLLILILAGLFLQEKPKVKEKIITENEALKHFETQQVMIQASRWFAPTVIACFLMMVSPWLSENIRDFYPVFHKPFTLVAPAGRGPWTGPHQTFLKSWEPVFINASAVLQVQYSNTDTFIPIYLYTAYYQSDRSIDEMLIPENKIFNPDIWNEVSSAKRFTAIRGLTVLETVLEGESTKRVQWSWYFVSGVTSIDLKMLKLMDTVRLIARHADGPGIIQISSAYHLDPDEARQNLNAFLQEMYGVLGILARPEQNLRQRAQRIL